MVMLPGQDQPYGSDAHIDYANGRMAAMQQKTGLEWNFDPAGDNYGRPCHRFRSFQGKYELLVYEDGRWVIFSDKHYGHVVGQGEEAEFDDAVDSLMLIYRKHADR